MDNEDEYIGTYQQLALQQTREEGCRCDPDIDVMTCADLVTGEVVVTVVVEHEDDCPWLLIANAPWN